MDTLAATGTADGDGEKRAPEFPMSGDKSTAESEVFLLIVIYQ